MGKNYTSADRRVPADLRKLFDSIVHKRIVRPAPAARVKSFDPSKEMIVEGIANLALPDRWDEVIAPTAWKKRLPLYMKNPLMLYEHDRSKPIGTCLEALDKSDGLYYRACIGDPSKAALTSVQMEVRSLLAQGILKANSVGFVPHLIEWDEDAEVLRYTDVELLEISIVSIPMQQDSVVTSVKSWKERRKMSAATTLESTPTDTQNPEQGSDDAGATLNEGGSTEPTIADVIGIVTEIKGLVQSHGEILTKMHGSDESAALRAQLDALTSENAGLKAQVEALSASCKSLEANGKKLLDNLRKQGLLKQ